MSQKSSVPQVAISLSQALMSDMSFKSTKPVSGISISLQRRQSYHGPFRCIDFDMRGYGQSERPSQRYDMEVWADDVAALMEHLELHSAHIHGTSMGGMVARQFAAKYPDRTQPYHRERR
jgi:pimeloyl-ACP methyl ester carboxylesterase